MLALLSNLGFKRAIDAELSAASAFSLAFGLLQYPIALTDGFYELRKHCFMGNVALCVALILLVSATIQSATAARIRKASTAAASD